MSGVIIKAGQTRTMAQGLLGLDLRDIARQADALLDAARAEARRIVEQATRDAEARAKQISAAAQKAGRAQGAAEGRKQGYEAALKEARERFAADQRELQATLSTLLAEFSQRREQLYATARRDVVVLAIAIAARVVERMTAIDEGAREAAATGCAEALALVSEASEATVRVHPADAKSIEQLADGPAAALATRHVRLIEDETVARGGVRVEAGATTVDAAAQSRVERIADELVAAWRKRMKELSLTA